MHVLSKQPSIVHGRWHSRLLHDQSLARASGARPSPSAPRQDEGVRLANMP